MSYHFFFYVVESEICCKFGVLRAGNAWLFHKIVLGRSCTFVIVCMFVFVCNLEKFAKLCVVPTYQELGGRACESAVRGCFLSLERSYSLFEPARFGFGFRLTTRAWSTSLGGNSSLLRNSRALEIATRGCSVRWGVPRLPLLWPKPPRCKDSMGWVGWVGWVGWLLAWPAG